MLKIIFYSDAEVFGGHEKMAVSAHAALRSFTSDFQIIWMISRKNLKLKSALDAEELPYSWIVGPPAFSFRRNPFSAALKILRNAVAFRASSPDLILIVQGNIASCFDGALSAKIARLPFCSYIPMVYRSISVKEYRFPVLPKLVWSVLYRSVSAYITIDHQQATRLSEENARAAISIVENFIPPRSPLERDGRLVKELGMPRGKRIVTVIGRIEFAHKSQDWLIKSLKGDRFLEDKYVLFVGSGSDEVRLKKLIRDGCQDHFGFLDWRDNLDSVYSASDLILIPSRLEGVPLVMLEGLGLRIPVVGTDQDGMKTWLPKAWRYDWGDVDGLKRAVDRALSGYSEREWQAIEARLKQIYDPIRFARDFRLCLLRSLGTHRLTPRLRQEVQDLNDEVN
jgi:glycosyltransferase involved in cell wall biosynthesis